MPKLPKAPLQEAIFEVRWELDVDPESNQQLDLGFALAQGKLRDIVRNDFPVFKRRVPPGVPEQFLSYQPVNQYWAGQDTFPILQLGPGIFSVNDTELNYDWPKTYFPLVRSAMSWVSKAYENDLRLNFACLRYIDSVKPKDYGFEGRWQEFIQEHFNFSFTNNFETKGVIKGVHFDQFFELTDKSTLQINMNSGKYRKTEEAALIWQTSVTKKSQGFELDSLLNWADYAHSVTSELFIKMTKPNFYASFK